MTAAELTLLGVAVTILTAIVGLITVRMWQTLPDNRKVWAMVVLVGWCGLLSMYPAFFAWAFGAPV